jgi:hypothetical protein
LRLPPQSKAHRDDQGRLNAARATRVRGCLQSRREGLWCPSKDVGAPWDRPLGQETMSPNPSREGSAGEARLRWLVAPGSRETTYLTFSTCRGIPCGESVSRLTTDRPGVSSSPLLALVFAAGSVDAGPPMNLALTRFSLVCGKQTRWLPPVDGRCCRRRLISTRLRPAVGRLRKPTPT